MENDKIKLSEDVTVTLVQTSGPLDVKEFYSYTAVEDGETITFTVHTVSADAAGAEIEIRIPGVIITSGGVLYNDGSWVSPALVAGEKYTFLASNRLDIDQVISIHMESNFPA